MYIPLIKKNHTHEVKELRERRYPVPVLGLRPPLLQYKERHYFRVRLAMPSWDAGQDRKAAVTLALGLSRPAQRVPAVSPPSSSRHRPLVLPPPKRKLFHQPKAEGHHPCSGAARHVRSI